MDENNGSNEQLNVSNENISANVIINISTERSNTINNSTEKSYKANDITVDESNEVTVQNAAELAGTIAATSGRPLMEVIDEGQVDLISSDEIEFFGSLPPILSDPPHDFADAMDESDSPPKDTSSPSSLSSHMVKLGLVMRDVAFALKPRARVGLLFVSPRSLSLCLGSTLCRRLLLANQKVFAVVLVSGRLICSSRP